MGRRKPPPLPEICGACGRFIRTLRDDRGELVTLDRTPVDEGRYVMERVAGGEVIAKRLPMGTQHRDILRHRFNLHTHE